jgi:hypothetical protein
MSQHGVHALRPCCSSKYLRQQSTTGTEQGHHSSDSQLICTPALFLTVLSTALLLPGCASLL